MKNKINCPNCGVEIDVDELLQHQAEKLIKSRYDKILEEKEKEIEEKYVKEKKKLTEETAKKTKELAEQEIKQLREDVEQKSKENLELKKKEVELMKKESELKTKQEEMKIEMDKIMFEKSEEIASEARRKEQEKYELRIKEYEKEKEDQKKLIEEMKRKAEQGSMQLQGEVLELALEDFLRSQYPFDIIEEVPKGTKGADVIQTVVNPMQQVCGKIIYESKRTKNFSDGWIEKLKDDQREQGALIAVIITEVLPKDIETFGRKDGVWICNFSNAKNLTFILREMIIRERSIRASEENKGDKMELLYNYLTSDEFGSRVEAIVESFSALKSDIEKEKRSMNALWKEREKKLEKVIANTVDMYGSIKGIGGNAIATVQSLTLPEPENSDDNSEKED
ncbi:MAG: DUF2130 domain-containing protein [Bacteroidetes bacterium]|nr:DUF2130 domain-containing protein [Bacteroidota bacterium]